MSKASVSNVERYVWENKLLTMRGGEFFGTRIKNIFLIGMMGFHKQVEKIIGQLLIISSNPMYLEENVKYGEKDWRFQSNMISMDKLPLTKSQRIALLRSSIFGGGRVSVYVGQFSLGHCVAPGNCRFLHSSSLSILRLICGNNCAFRVEVDMERVVSLTNEQLNDIILVNMEEAFGQHEDIGVGSSSTAATTTFTSQIFSEKKPKTQQEQLVKRHGSLVGELKGGEAETFRFWKLKSNQLLVEMICPKSHWGYEVDLEFYETLISEPNVEDPFHGPKISRVLIHDNTSIKPTKVSNSAAKAGKYEVGHQSCLNERLVSKAVMLLPMPDYSNDADQSLLDAWKIRDIIHFCKVRLIRNKNPEKIGPKSTLMETTAKIGYKKVLRRSNTFPPTTQQKVFIASQTAPCALPPSSSPQYVINAEPVVAHSYFQCCFPVTLSLMKAALSDENESRNGAQWENNCYKASGAGVNSSTVGGYGNIDLTCFTFWHSTRLSKE